MEQLKIGDIVQRFRCQGSILEHEYLIASESKTEVKSKDGARFKKKISTSGYVTKIGASQFASFKKKVID